MDEDDPMCMVTTVSVSQQASQSGSHPPLWSEANPNLAGFSVKAMA